MSSRWNSRIWSRLSRHSLLRVEECCSLVRAAQEAGSRAAVRALLVVERGAGHDGWMWFFAPVRRSARARPGAGRLFVCSSCWSCGTSPSQRKRAGAGRRRSVACPGTGFCTGSCTDLSRPHRTGTPQGRRFLMARFARWCRVASRSPSSWRDRSVAGACGVGRCTCDTSMRTRATSARSSASRARVRARGGGSATVSERVTTQTCRSYRPPRLMRCAC
jgi:hypothetical protein